MISQLIANAIIGASAYALAGIAFILIFAVCRRFDLSIAAMIPLGAYMVFTMQPYIGLIIAAVIAIFLSLLLGCIFEIFIFTPIAKAYETELPSLLAAIGLFTVISNILSLIYGDNRVTIRTWPVREGISVLGARITLAQIIAVLTAISLLGLLWCFLELTRLGKEMRAVADNPSLARTVGINTEVVLILSSGISSALGALAGVVIAADIDITPAMGMRPFMMGVVAMILGGGTAWRTLFGAVFLSMSQHLSMIWISSRWQDAIAFLLLMFVLVLRPKVLIETRIRSI